MRHCKHCSAEHPLTTEYWYRLEGSPRCKLQVAARKRCAYDPVKQREMNTAYRAQHRDRLLEDSRKWREKNCERHRENARKWYYANRDHVRVKHNQYMRRREKEDSCFLLSRRVRTRLYQAVKSGKCEVSAVRDLGCSLEYLRKYIEEQFHSNMSWDNYGTYWELDHIMPLANYQLTDRSTLRHLVHYTNLQPLLVADNRRKRNKELINE